jgi:hypothetical protein
MEDKNCTYSVGKIMGGGFYEGELCSNTFKPVAAPCNPNHVNQVSEIPAERMQKMQVHYALLKKKFPHMKEKRIARKVAEEFKIKLV